MTLKFIIAKLEDADEQHRALYKKRDDGRFQLDTEGAEGTEDVQALKNALAREKEEQLALKQKIDGLSQNELKELKKLKKEREDADRKKLEDDGNFDAVKAQMIAKHNEEMATAATVSTTLRKQLEKVLVSDAATQAIVEAKGNPKLLGPIVRAAMSLDEVNGEFVVRVIDSAGKPLVSDAKGTPMTIGQYVETLKAIPDYQPAFSATGAGGGGSGPTSGNADTSKPVSKWTGEEKIEFIKSKGAEAYRELVAKQST